MNFKSAAKLEAEIYKLTQELEAQKRIEAGEFNETDLALQRSISEITKAYEKRDWLKMKNAAAYIVEAKHDINPVITTPENEFDEIITSGAGMPFPPNWNIPKDIYMPRGKFTVFQAKQKTGKTRAMLSDLLYLAQIGHRVAIASGEMPTGQLWLNLWMQDQFLRLRNSWSEIDARIFIQTKDPRKEETKKNIYDFRKKYDGKIFALYTPGWTARRQVYGLKLAENVTGKKPTVWAIDYAQIIGKDQNIRDFREGHIQNSIFLTNAFGIENVGGILVSQSNDAGNTSESQQYERDAGMVINFYRKEEESGEKSPTITIHVKHSRSTASGKFDRWLDVRSGAIVPDAGYTPEEAQGTFYESKS